MRALLGAVVPVASIALALPLGASASWHYSAIARTPSYRLAFEVGPSETMYTRAQVQAQHPTMGEVMLGGSMSMGNGGHAMGMEGGATRHLEVHVTSRTTGKVVHSPKPKLSLEDLTAMSMASPLQAVAMEDVGEGASSFHFGNNVTLQAGHRYRVVVTVAGQRATFAFKAG